MNPKQKPKRNRTKFDEDFTNFDQPGAYSRKILRYIKNKEKELRKNEAYSLHGPRRKKFPRRKLIVYYPGQIIQMDLVDMQKISTKNKNFKYILMIIDCFSKKAWAEPLKSKSGGEVAGKIKTVFENMKYPVQTVIFDEGKEFDNQKVDKLFRQYGIHSYSILTDQKAAAVERLNRTVKSIIWKYFTDKNTQKWIEVLPKIINNYNSTFHRTINMAPNDVSFENRKRVFKKMFPKINASRVCKLKLGSRVRVALHKKIFEKGYTINWSEEVFTVTKIKQRLGVCWYQISDQSGKIYDKLKYYYDLRLVADD